MESLIGEHVNIHSRSSSRHRSQRKIVREDLNDEKASYLVLFKDGDEKLFPAQEVFFTSDYEGKAKAVKLIMGWPIWLLMILLWSNSIREDDLQRRELYHL